MVLYQLLKSYLFDDPAQSTTIVYCTSDNTKTNQKFAYTRELNIPAEELKKILKNEFYDVKIIVGDSEEIMAHKFLLSAFSSVLHKEAAKDAVQDPIHITSYNYHVIRELINYMYNYYVNLNEENVKELLFAAIDFQVGSLQKICEKFIYDKLKIGDALETLVFASQNNIDELKLETLGFIVNKIRDLKPEQLKSFSTNHPRIFADLFEKTSTEIQAKMSEVYKEATVSFVSDKDNFDGKILEDLESLYREMPHSDITLDVNGTILKAHKSMLSVRSKFFNAILAKEPTKSSINITEFSAETVEQVLMFIYCGKVTKLKEKNIELFLAGDKYDLEKLKNWSRISVIQNLKVENVLRVLEVAHLDQTGNLKTEATRFFGRNVLKVIETTDWRKFASSHPVILNEILSEFLKDTK